jgi:hypothetical protein
LVGVENENPVISEAVHFINHPDTVYKRLVQLVFFKVGIGEDVPHFNVALAIGFHWIFLLEERGMARLASGTPVATFSRSLRMLRNY